MSERFSGSTRGWITVVVAVAVWLGLVGPARAQTAGEARDLALVALRLEFQRDGLAATPDELTKAFDGACNRGYNPACRRSTWLVDGRPDPNRVVGVFEPSCEAGDVVACLVTGWALDQIAAVQTNADDRDRTWRKAARQLKADCDGGYQPACHDYAGYLYDNKGVVSDPAPALRRWKAACDAGELASCTTLARLYRDGGSGVTASPELAGKLATQACTGGYIDGCAVVGELTDAGWSAAKLDAFYGKLCDAGHRESCWRLARVYYDGIHPEPTPGRLQGLFERGCDLGHARSCYEAGRWDLDHGGDINQAAGRFGRACELGDAAGCSSQVDLMLTGRVAGTVREAYDAFNVACDVHQSIRACMVLAFALIDGVQVPRDAERGRALLQRVCVDERSDAASCFTLGRSFEEGLGGDRDRTEATKYYRWACAADHYEACMRRGDLLVSDVGVRRDDHEALNMYQRACDGAIAGGCYEAGRILDEATYVKQDLAQAAVYYGRACDAGEARGCFGLGKVSERGANGTPDMKGARDAYERAIAAGSLDAKRALARLLWNGYGGGRAHGRAKQLCREACQSGDAVACRGPSFL
ncbi:MAG: tetratricopeptide repeat protein [Myxococcota bacterium]